VGELRTVEDWPSLRRLIKDRLQENVKQLLEICQTSSTNAPSSPTEVDAQPTAQRHTNGSINQQQLEASLELIYHWLEHTCVDAPPFTIQRLAELVLTPTTHYRHPEKYLRAVQRVSRAIHLYTTFNATV
jgi:hypothetical protein